jgi:hypothetical protein
MLGQQRQERDRLAEFLAEKTDRRPEKVAS